MKKNGFTLVEISIVLIVIGIIIGGALVGRSLADSSKRTAVVADFQKYATAANSYFTKFGYWPGDDAERSTKWTAAPNGDGNGSLPDPTVSELEYYYFWQDLDSAHANFIVGTYSGTVGQINTMPKTALTNSWIGHYYDSTAANTTNQAFYVNGVQRVGWGTTGVPNATTFTPVITGRGAAAIDAKIDDGITGTGSVIGLRISGGAANCNYTDAATNTTTICNIYYIYKR